MRLWPRILDFFYPPKCAFCRKLLSEEEEMICTDCFRRLPYTADKTIKCDMTAGLSAPLFYEDMVREALLRYKFQGASHLSTAFSRLLANKLRQEDISCDVVTWVPLSRKRLRERGYDQARLLAEKTAEQLECVSVPLLKKTRHTSRQSGLHTAAERRANVSGCYEVIAREQVAGKRILLIDDITTTGATFSECARVLLTAGAEEVHAAALACRREQDEYDES